jgi:hypothetical protein
MRKIRRNQRITLEQRLDLSQGNAVFLALPGVAIIPIKPNVSERG